MSRSLTNEPPMLRLFVVQVYTAARTLETIRVIGNTAQVLPDGSLQVLRFYGEIPWTVKLVRNGDWHSVDAALPDANDIKRVEIHNLHRVNHERLMASETKGKAH